MSNSAQATTGHDEVVKNNLWFSMREPSPRQLEQMGPNIEFLPELASVSLTSAQVVSEVVEALAEAARHCGAEKIYGDFQPPLLEAMNARQCTDTHRLRCVFLYSPWWINPDPVTIGSHHRRFCLVGMMLINE